MPEHVANMYKMTWREGEKWRRKWRSRWRAKVKLLLLLLPPPPRLRPPPPRVVIGGGGAGGGRCLHVVNLPVLLLLISLIYLPRPCLGVAAAAEQVVGVAGGRTGLPCHIHTSAPNDRAILALWYVQGRRLPVYSYDARGAKGLYQPDKVLAGRSTFDTSTSPAKLLLDPVASSDQGVYTCRVDFLHSPTHNTVVNLTVIEPPRNLTIVNEAGVRVRHRIGPINEGAPLKLTCYVTGGRPQPTVTWRSEGELIKMKSEVTAQGQLRSDLVIPEVSRAYHLKTFSCQAQNNNQQRPLSQEVTIDMNLRPLSVRVRQRADPLLAGQQYTFSCESQGSRPPATITWFENGQQVDAMHTHTRSSPGEITTGTVTIVPTQGDHEAMLKCQASNELVPGSAISDTVELNVQYAPVVVLEMGRNLVPSSIKQGDDVYFECRVEANPPPYRVTWARNREEVHHNASHGIILSGNSLVLQQVERSSAGEYTCAATNTRGTQNSNPVTLDVMYPPECMMDRTTVLAVGRGERVNISCRVASNPPRATFHWRLNGSERTYTSRGEPLPWGHVASHYAFEGASDKDYGMLHCWANNSVGVQEQPCVFQIIPAGPPSSPERCAVVNNTAENIEVQCERGFDGGMRQLFLAEVYAEGGSLHLNRSSEEPVFSVESLRPGTAYSIRVSAFNEKGRSPAIHLDAVTLKVAEQRVGENKSLLYSPLIIIFLAIVGVFLTLILILILLTRWRKNNPPTANQGRAKSPPEEAENEGKEENGKQGCGKKKKVVVIENGMKDRVGHVVSDVSTSKDALLGPTTLTLANGCAGHYSSLGKAAPPSNTLPRPLPSTTPSHTRPLPSTQTSHSHFTLNPLPSSASHTNFLPINDDRSGFVFSRYSETLPRNHGRGNRDLDEYSDYGRGSGRGNCEGDVGYRRGSINLEGYSSGVGGGTSDSLVDSLYRSGDYRSGVPGVGGLSRLREYENYEMDAIGGGGEGEREGGEGQEEGEEKGEYYLPGGGGSACKERYNLLEEIRNNPKYVVRTRGADGNDESFV